MPRDTILFDINETILDLTSLKPKFKAAFGDEGVTATWFSMLLHTSTVCVLTGVKTDFATLAGAMLDKIAARSGVSLPNVARDEILGGFASLPAHADVKPALTRLRSAGYRTVAFTNSSLNLVTSQIDNAGLAKYYDDIVSVEKTGSFKPDAKVYRFVAEHLGRPIGELRLIATHDWDTHGALAAGMLAAYIDRSGAPYHPLFQRPDVYATTMDDVVQQIIARDGEK
ncbi:MAG: haloacid dehalogenase type II [Halothiobacillus sp.]|jgi:2-haloacid dehalogenase|nr:haloacid dehalogenase type II [Halothiobacillus sp.]